MLEGEAERLREEIAYMKLRALEDARDYMQCQINAAYKEWVDAAF